MSIKKVALFALGLVTVASSQTTCSSMFAGLTCRTASEDPSQVNAGSVASSRNWLCSSYPQICSAINSGGQYSSCNSVEQLSYAMNVYYSQFQAQGPSACNFGGIGVLVTPSSGSSGSSGSSTGSSSNTATQTQCQAMFAQASCRTASEDPSQVNAGSVTSSRNWLCGAYPQFCTAINSGGAYASCNSVEQLTYAMSLYYNQFKSQGASACSFGGIGNVNANAGSSNTGSSTGSSSNTGSSNTGSSSSGVDCTAMFTGLGCRTTSQNPASLSSSALSNARSWLCSNYGQFCTAINSGGQYSSCNSAEQMSYAMNQYYQQFSYQGSSACSFGGIGQIVSSSSGNSGVVVTPTPAPQLSSKAGLAWPINQFGDGTNPSLAPWAQGKISWIYTWSYDYSPLAISNTNLEWVPMLHSQGDANNFISRIQSGAYDNVKNMLLFNEPDLNYPPYAYAVDVNTAVGITLQVFQAIQQRGINPRVGTPAMSYNMGWLQQYLAAVSAQCSTCKFSFVPVHMYTTDSNAFKANVQNYYNTFGLPVWVTEFADTDFSSRSWQVGFSTVQQFMSDTTNWLNAQSWVERYSWFGVMRAVDIQDKANMCMNMDGSRNTLGNQYVLNGGSL